NPRAGSAVARSRRYENASAADPPRCSIQPHTRSARTGSALRTAHTASLDRVHRKSGPRPSEAGSAVPRHAQLRRLFWDRSGASPVRSETGTSTGSKLYACAEGAAAWSAPAVTAYGKTTCQLELALASRAPGWPGLRLAGHRR